MYAKLYFIKGTGDTTDYKIRVSEQRILINEFYLRAMAMTRSRPQPSFHSANRFNSRHSPSPFTGGSIPAGRWITKSASDSRLRRSEPRRRDSKQQTIRLVGVKSGCAVVRSSVVVDVLTLVVAGFVFVLDTEGSSSGSRVRSALEGEGKVDPGAELANRPRRG